MKRSLKIPAPEQPLLVKYIIPLFFGCRAILAFAALLLPEIAFSAEHQIGSWSVFEQNDPITDQPRVLAILDNPRESAWFRVGCERGKALLSVSVRYRYRPEDRVAVVLRIDEQAPLVSEWTPQAGTGIVWATLSRSTYEMLATAKTVAVQISLKDRGTTVLVFPAVKTQEALRPLIKACPIESAVEKRDARPFNPTAPMFPTDPIPKPQQ